MEGIAYEISGKFQHLFPASIKKVGDLPQDNTFPLPSLAPSLEYITLLSKLLLCVC